MPLYENITGRMVVYWFSQIGVSGNKRLRTHESILSHTVICLERRRATHPDLDQRNLL